MRCVSSRRRSKIWSVSCISCRSLLLKLVRYYLQVLFLDSYFFRWCISRFSLQCCVFALYSTIEWLESLVQGTRRAQSSARPARIKAWAALNGAGVSPSRSPGRNDAGRKPRLSQPTSSNSRSSRVPYPGASGESISRERTRCSHGRGATPYLLHSHVFLHLHINMYEYSV